MYNVHWIPRVLIICFVSPLHNIQVLCLPLMVLVVAMDGSRWIYLVHLPIYGWTWVSWDILWPWHQISDSFSLKAFSCCLNLILSLQLWKLLHTPWDVFQASWCNLIFSGFKCFIWLHLGVTCEMSGGCVLANLPHKTFQTLQFNYSYF